MKRKIFYSIVQKDEITGIKKQEGYEIDIDGEKFNAYKNRNYERVYILDPKNGVALLTYDYKEKFKGMISEIELIDMARKKLMQSENLKKWKELQNRKSYKLTIKIFKAYMRAESLRKEQKDDVYREIKERETVGK